jgi:hypothetical protein
MIEQIQQPWPWYVAGIIIGLIVPALLILGNKSFGISSNLRHVCAACFPANIKFFKYDWKKEIWNFFFVGGIFLGAFLANHYLMTNAPIEVNPALQTELAQYGITNYNYMLPSELFSFEALFTLRGFIMMVLGGFKRGVVVSEFSTDSGMTENAADIVSTQSAVRGYIDKRLSCKPN